MPFLLSHPGAVHESLLITKKTRAPKILLRWPRIRCLYRPGQQRTSEALKILSAGLTQSMRTILGK